MQECPLFRIRHSWHALVHLKDALDAAYGEASKQAKKHFQRLRKILKQEYGFQRVLRALRHLASCFPGRKTIRDVLRYFQAHADRMAYADAKRRGAPIGSGNVELSNKSICKMHMKAPECVGPRTALVSQSSHSAPCGSPGRFSLAWKAITKALAQTDFKLRTSCKHYFLIRDNLTSILRQRKFTPDRQHMLAALYSSSGHGTKRPGCRIGSFRTWLSSPFLRQVEAHDYPIGILPFGLGPVRIHAVVQPTGEDQHLSSHGFVSDFRPTHSWALGVGNVFDRTHQVLGTRIDELDLTPNSWVLGRSKRRSRCNQDECGRGSSHPVD